VFGTLSLREFLTTFQVTQLDQSSHSPDLASNDFFQFSKLINSLEGCHFEPAEDIKQNEMSMKGISED
jgi:hypothetical protein